MPASPLPSAPERAAGDRSAPGPAPAAGEELVSFLETDLSRPFAVGRGAVLHLLGWCYHPRRRIRQLWVMLGGTAHPARHGLGRPDVLWDMAPRADAAGYSIESGFWAMVPMEPLAAPRSLPVALRAVLAGGEVQEVTLGEVRLVPGPSAEPVAQAKPEPRSGEGPLVAVCLATYKPALDLLEIQMESLRRQTHRNWIGIVNDDGSPPAAYAAIRQLAARDPRFQVFRNEERLGFYRNFERCLARVPAGVDFVALCDQDDDWYPDKIEASLGAFGPETQLVYCDMDLVTREGALLSHTYWTTRRNNFRDLETLLLANTVTGAASVFRADLLPELLPFPHAFVSSFHDHWLACAALVKGRIDYVDRPLYAYRQHGSNVLGHHAPEASRLLPRARSLLRWARSPFVARGELRERLKASQHVFLNDVLRLVLLAQTLELRFPSVAPAKRAVLRRVARFDRSLPALVAQGLKYEVLRRPTLGAEWYLLRAAAGHRAHDLWYRRSRRRIYHKRLLDDAPQSAATGSAPVLSAGSFVDELERKMAPLALDVSAVHPRRVNLLIPTIDFRYFFGGYIAKFNLARMLRRAGIRVRVVAVDPCTPDPAAWRRHIAEYQDLADFFDEVEVACAFDRSQKLPVSPADAFVATTWWTAHIAHRAARDLGRERFVYLIQEYEPMTFPMGSCFALADESYGFPHFALFSTELLRDWFRESRLGVFREDRERGEEESAVFENAINAFRVDAADLRARTARRLLFYARPEQHAARNMFELGVMALRRAVAEDAFGAAAWEFHGIGTVGNFRVVPLGRGAELRMVPRVGLQEYVDLLPTYDVGLALMLTPHPSLVPLDMAAAGLVTVTNTYATKTAERIEALSRNLVAAPPTVPGIAGALRIAARRAADAEARVAGSRVRWANTWDAAFDEAVLRKVVEFLDRAAAAPGEGRAPPG